MGSENKWTPGPWLVRRNNAFWEVVPSSGCGQNGVPYTVGNVCASDPGDPDGGLQEATAHLIAAAPDLHDALQELADWYTEHTGLPACKANAALAKARGES